MSTKTVPPTTTPGVRRDGRELRPPVQRSVTDALRARLRDRDLQRILVNLSAIVVLAIVAQSVTGYFFLPRNIAGLFVQIAVVAMIACAVSLVMVARAIDISVGGIVVLSGVVAGLLSRAGLPLWLSFAGAVVTGMLVGLVNSFLILAVKINSMIATIGTLYMCQGVANLLTNGLPVTGVPDGFSAVGTSRPFGIPVQVPIVLLFLLAFVLIQRYTSLGVHTVATGSNPDGAFLNGVNVRRTITICFLLSGLAAGWGGVVYASRIGNPVPVLDNDLLFQVIVACVIGGTSLNGGQGRVFGAFCGALLIATVNNTLNLLGVSTFWQYIALGVLLIVAVALDTGLREQLAGFRKRLRGSGSEAPTSFEPPPVAAPRP